MVHLFPRRLNSPRQRKRKNLGSRAIIRPFLLAVAKDCVNLHQETIK